jgi:hypothetical protein
MVEHTAHSFDVTGVPRTDILIERLSMVEHTLHISDVTGVPVANILIERGSTTEHTPHSFDLTGVGIREGKFGDACPDVIFGEGTLYKIVFLEFTILKQSTTIGGKQSSLFLKIRPQIWLLSIDALKSCLFIKASWFLSDLSNAPRTDILIERVSTTEHIFHSFDVTGVPVTNILIERASIKEHPLHSFDVTGVPVANVLIE